MVVALFELAEISPVKVEVYDEEGFPRQVCMDLLMCAFRCKREVAPEEFLWCCLAM